VSSLREYWPDLDGAKDELCLRIAGMRNIEDIKQFLESYFSCCKQHIYVYSHDTKLASLPVIDIPDGELVTTKSDAQSRRLLYVVRVGFNVVLRNPLEEAVVEFLWPIILDFTETHLIIRAVVLEKNIGTYVDERPFRTFSRSADEDIVLKELERTFKGTLKPTDLHKGVKKLWHDDFMDATRTQYKKSLSVASEIMDEERGIKKFNPELYAVLRRSPLLKTSFQVAPNQETSVTAFSAEPLKGYIGFPRYSEERGDTDHVVNEILRHN
jgi:hypothetical protein